MTPGLVGSWSFNGKDLSGTTAFDRSGKGNNGTLTNGPAPTIGKIGQALSFDGTDDYVNVTTMPDLTNNYTVSAWIYPTAGGTYGGTRRAFVYTGSCSAPATFDPPMTSVMGDDGGSQKIMIGGACGVVNGTYTATTVNLNQWLHLVITIDASNVWRVYFNGTQDANTATYAATLKGSALQIGGGTIRPFQGNVDEVRIYNTALSATEITNLYNLGR